MTASGNIIRFKDPALRYDMALNMMKNNRIKEAVINLEKISEKDTKVYLSLLQGYRVLKRTEDVIRILKQLIKLKPLKYLIDALIAELEKNKLHAAAFCYILKGYRQFPHDPDYKQKLIDNLIKKEKYHTALRLLKKHQVCFSSEKYHYYLGLLYRETGRKIRAALIFRRMTATYPFNTLYRYMLASVYESLKMHRKSEKQLLIIRDFLSQIPKLMRFNTAENPDPFKFFIDSMLNAHK